MDDIFQSLEKMVRDVEKGALQVDSIVKLNGIEYDAKCYHVYMHGHYRSRSIRIDLTERSVPVGA